MFDTVFDTGKRETRYYESDVLVKTEEQKEIVIVTSLLMKRNDLREVVDCDKNAPIFRYCHKPCSVLTGFFGFGLMCSCFYGCDRPSCGRAFFMGVMLLVATGLYGIGLFLSVYTACHMFWEI